MKPPRGPGKILLVPLALLLLLLLALRAPVRGAEGASAGSSRGSSLSRRARPAVASWDAKLAEIDRLVNDAKIEVCCPLVFASPLLLISLPITGACQSGAPLSARMRISLPLRPPSDRKPSSVHCNCAVVLKADLSADRSIKVAAAEAKGEAKIVGRLNAEALQNEAGTKSALAKFKASSTAAGASTKISNYVKRKADELLYTIKKILSRGRARGTNVKSEEVNAPEQQVANPNAAQGDVGAGGGDVMEGGEGGEVVEEGGA